MRSRASLSSMKIVTWSPRRNTVAVLVAWARPTPTRVLSTPTVPRAETMCRVRWVWIWRCSSGPAKGPRANRWCGGELAEHEVASVVVPVPVLVELVLQLVEVLGRGPPGQELPDPLMGALVLAAGLRVAHPGGDGLDPQRGQSGLEHVGRAAVLGGERGPVVGEHAAGQPIFGHRHAERLPDVLAVLRSGRPQPHVGA